MSEVEGSAQINAHGMREIMTGDDCDMPLTAPQVLEMLELMGPQPVDRLHRAFDEILTKEEVIRALEYLVLTGLVLFWQRPNGGYQVLCRSPLLSSRHLRSGPQL